MNYRLATILAKEEITTDFTKVIDLNLADPVTQFHIVYESTGGAVGLIDHHAARCLTKIELVDGSDVLFSLTGQECQAVDFYHRKVEPPNMSIYLTGHQAVMVYNINFGKYLFDPILAFDPKKFTNPQLKITIDRNAGGFVSLGGFLTVLAHIFDGKAVTPTGFFMHKEIMDYGLGDGTHEYVDLPTDYPYRKLFIAAQTEGVGPEYLINTIKLSEDNDRKVPLSLSMREILRTLCAQTPPYREALYIAAGNATVYYYCTPCYLPIAQATSCDADFETHPGNAYGGDGGRGQLMLEAAGHNWNIEVVGYAPHGAIEIPFGLQDDPTDWYDVTTLGSLRLDILAIAGRGETDKVQVFMQQIRNYA